MKYPVDHGDGNGYGDGVELVRWAKERLDEYRLRFIRETFDGWAKMVDDHVNGTEVDVFAAYRPANAERMTLQEQFDIDMAMVRRVIVQLTREK